MKLDDLRRKFAVATEPKSAEPEPVSIAEEAPPEDRSQVECTGCGQTVSPAFDFTTNTDYCPQCGSLLEIDIEVAERLERARIERGDESSGVIKVEVPTYAGLPIESIPCPECGMFDLTPPPETHRADVLECRSCGKETRVA